MKNSLIKKCTLNHTVSIRDAINNLVHTSQRIVFVINKSNNFLGTIADGDIRRGLINGLTLNDPINLITNKKPIITNKKIHETEIKKLMKKMDISHIPLVQKKNNICLLKR